MIKNKKTLSSIEVERILGISKRTLFNWTKQGKLREDKDNINPGSSSAYP